MPRVLQCVAFSGLDSRVLVTTSSMRASAMVRGAPGLVGEAVEPVVEEALPPLADGRHRDPEVRGDFGVGFPRGCGGDDAGAEGESLGRLRSANPGFELGAFVVGEGERLELGHGGPP